MNLTMADWNGLTVEQVAELGRILDLDDEHASMLAAILTGFAGLLNIVQSRRREVGEIRDEKEKLSRIHRLATALADELDDAIDPVVIVTGSHFDPMSLFASSEASDIKRAVEEKKAALFNDELRSLAYRAGVLATSDERFRTAHLLLPIENAGKLAEAVVLWPQLFRFWEETGHRVATTPDGPMHRFICFIHKCFGLGKPNARTIRDAVGRWNSGGREQVIGRYPAWRSNEVLAS